MTDQFVTNKQAIALKELGFDKPCIAWIDSFDNEFHFWRNIVRLVSFDMIPDSTVVPTKQQVIEWMLEKHYIYGWVEHYWYPLGHRWRACIKNITQTKSQSQGEFRSYQEALDYVITWGINKIKNES